MEQFGDHVHPACRYFRCRRAAGHTASAYPSYAGVAAISPGGPSTAGGTAESPADSSAPAASDHPVIRFGAER